MKTDEELVGDFIRRHDLAVLSTVSTDHLPQSAAVGILVGDNHELFFGTMRGSRKDENIRKNPRVSLVIGWDAGKTVQYEGEAYALQGAAADEFMAAHMGTMSTAAKYLPKREAVFYKVSPRWIKYVDCSKDPWDEIVIKF